MTFKERFDDELRRNLRWGLFAVGIVFVFMAGYYLNAVSLEAKTICSECFEDKVCADTDRICGDYGVYYFKLASLFALGGVGTSILFPLYLIKLKEGEVINNG